jgi:hypothetical protein
VNFFGTSNLIFLYPVSCPILTVFHLLHNPKRDRGPHHLHHHDTWPSPCGRRRTRLPRHTSRASRFPGHVQRVCDVHPLPEVQSSPADLSTSKMLFIQSTLTTCRRVAQSLHKSVQKPPLPPSKNYIFLFQIVL